MIYFCFSCLLLACLSCVWFLVKDRNFWRNEYRTRDREGRDRERQLFDQMLLLKGFRSTSAPTMPQPSIAKSSALSPEDLEIIDDRINERVEAGIMTPSEGWILADQVRNGTKTTAEADRLLWKRSQKEFPGSVADID